MTTLDVYRKDILLTTIKPEDDSKMSKKIMGDNILSVNIIVNDPIAFKLTDKVLFFGEWYYLNKVPLATKLDTATYKYTLNFESSQCMLKRIQYLFLGDDNSLKEGEFTLRGRPQMFMNLLQQNLKRLEPDFYFTLFEVYDAPEQNISFVNSNCLDALGLIADAFGTEYFILGSQIWLTKRQVDKGYTFRNGPDKGAYEITKKSADNTNLVTRIFPFGSDKNLPDGYRNFSKYLKMAPLPREIVSEVTVHRAAAGGQLQYTFAWTPPNVDGATGVRVTQKRYNPVTKNFGQWTNPQILPLSGGVYTSPFNTVALFQFETVLDGGSIGKVSGELQYPKFGLNSGTQDDGSVRLPLPVTEVLYLEKNIETYGVWEAKISFPDIYPHRTGTVTSVDNTNVYTFVDAGIDFNINSYTLPGKTAKVTFNSGQLQGYTFEINKYDATAKRITIVKNKDEATLDIPSDSLRPAIGDTYVITDIALPQEYVDNAEQELKEAAQLYLNENCEPQLTFALKLDPKFMKVKKWSLELGDLVWIVDVDLDVSKKMRITSIGRDVVNEDAYDIEISDALTKTKLNAIISQQGAISSSVNNLAYSIQNSALNNNRIINVIIVTPQGDIKFEAIKSNPAASPIGIGADGLIYKI